MLFNIIEKIQEDGKYETGKCINTLCSMIFRYGVAKGYCDQDITQHYRGMLKSVKVTHLATLTDPKEIGKLLKDIQAYNGKIVVKTALSIVPNVFLRPNELANSQWEFVDFESSQWFIPPEFMKMKREHLIPMPTQVIQLLKSPHPITGNSKYIFPNDRDSSKPMGSQTINQVLKRLENGKYKGCIVSHGFRSMASTILNENKFRSDVIEKQLAHEEKNKVRGAYNHAEYLEERTDIMQWYADHLKNLTIS